MTLPVNRARVGFVFGGDVTIPVGYEIRPGQEYATPVDHAHIARCAARRIAKGEPSILQIIESLGYTTTDAGLGRKHIVQCDGTIVFTGMAHDVEDWLRRNGRVA